MKLAVASVVLAVAVSSAAAQPESPYAGKSVLVVPFTGDGSDAERQQITDATLRGVRRSGANAELAKTTADDLIAINGCVPSDTSCLQTIPAALGVDIVVFGKVSDEGTSRSVTVVRVSGDDLERRNAEPDAVEQQSAELFGVAPAPEPTESDGDETIREGYTGDLGAGSGALDNKDGDRIGPYGSRDRPSLDFSQVEPYSWYVAIGGGGAVALGGLFWLLGNSTQGDIDGAPTETVSDLEELENMEGRARLYYGIGNTLAITGLVAAAVGGALIFYQAGPGADSGPAPAEPATTALGITPIEGGAMITVGGRR